MKFSKLWFGFRLTVIPARWQERINCSGVCYQLDYVGHTRKLDTETLRLCNKDGEKQGPLNRLNLRKRTLASYSCSK